MFNNDLFSDVKFVVRGTDGESESTQVIPAHKFVLSISSPVFEAMFYGELAETKDSIELPDCDYDSLLELFRYIYSDEVNLSGSNVMGVLYLAKKYIVPSLAQKCSEYLQENLDPSNVFSILPSAQKYEEKSLVDQCWEVIDGLTEEAVKSDGFATVQRFLLEAVVERDTLCISEVELFKGVMQWVTKESEKQGLVADGQVKRRILGERIVKGIRFPLMSLEEFSSVVLDSKILTLDEVTEIIKFISSGKPSSSLGFPVLRRAANGLKRCCRFGSVMPGCIYKTNMLIFSVNRSILFHGIYLFGRKKSNYFVTLKIKLPDDTTVALKQDQIFSVLHKSGNYWGFDVLLDQPVRLMKFCRYCVEADIRGLASAFSGNAGKSTVKCSGVTFKFEDRDQTEGRTNATGILQGQMHEFLFSL